MGFTAGIHANLKPIGCIFPTAETARDIHNAEAWLKEQGCSTAYGPMYPQTWYPYRACLGPFERPFFWGNLNFLQSYGKPVAIKSSVNTAQPSAPICPRLSAISHSAVF